MRRPNPKERRHAGPTARASDEQYRLAYGTMNGTATYRHVAAKAGVSHVTAITWRKLADAAIKEIGLERIGQDATMLRDMFVKNGPELGKVLGVSKKAAKGLEVVLRGMGILKGSRIYNIAVALGKSPRPLPRRVLRRKFHLSNTEVTRLMHKLGWNNAER